LAPLAVTDSVAPLPPEIHDVFLAMDRKYQGFMAMDEKSRFEQDPELFKLTGVEKNAFRFIDSHYSSNRMPPPGHNRRGVKVVPD
jgi:hypothetical protein